MGFVKLASNGFFCDRYGKKIYLVGTNFSGGYVCADFWRDWRLESIRNDLDIMRDMGLNCVRFPIVWDTFEPEEGVFDEKMLGRLKIFLDMCLECGLYAMPWCLVGVATTSYDVCWRNGRSFLFDESMVRAEERHLATLAARYRDHEAILCWDICDEPEWYSRLEQKDTLPYPTEDFTAWVGRMKCAIREADPNHQITLGFGHIATGRYGMDLRECAKQLDFMAVTAYAGTHGGRLNAPRPTYEMQFHMDMNRRSGPCFFCEAPGQSNARFSEEAIAQYYNTTLYTGLLHGSCGALTWVFSDYDESICSSDPAPGRRTLDGANRHPNEPWFGMFDEHRNKRKCALKLEEFGKTVRKLNVTDYRFPDCRTALIIPRGYHSASWDLVNEMIAAHAVLCGADLLPKAVWYDELDAADTPIALLAAPNESEIRTEDWKRLAEYVENGGTLIMTHPSGSIYFPRLTGCFYNDCEKHKDNNVFLFRNGSGSIEFENISDSRTILEPFACEIIAEFADGEPALVGNTYGRGNVYTFAANPITAMHDCSESAWHDSPIFTVLRMLAKDAGFHISAVCEDPGVHVGLMCGKTDDLLVAVNCNRFPINAAINVKGKKIDIPFEAGEGKVLRISR